MFGIEDLVAQFLGGSPVAAIVAGFSVLIILNLVLSLILAYRSKTDDINFNILPDFIQPLLLYSAFIIAIEAMMIVAVGIPAIKTVLAGVELVGVASVLIKYVKQIYEKLKRLGMPVDEKIDAIVEEKLDGVLGTLSDATPYIQERPEGWYPEGYEKESER